MTNETARNPAVDWFFDEPGPWREEYRKLREIALGAGLTEELKWGKPTYALGKANVFLMHGFREYCALLFMKGALMKDERGILVRQTENVQAARQLRFTSDVQIAGMEGVIRAYMQEAVAVEKAGLSVEWKGSAEFAVPEEFQRKLDELPALKTAFDALTPGRQRAYLLHFAAPKKTETRAARVEKHVQRIFEGKGLDDPD